MVIASVECEVESRIDVSNLIDTTRYYIAQREYINSLICDCYMLCDCGTDYNAIQTGYDRVRDALQYLRKRYKIVIK